MVREFNIVIAGVGGQGTILMAEILGEAATIEGLKVRGSEILGMAVRGGPVSSIIRVGSEVYGPLVPEGKGDVLVGLEPTEALRNIAYLSKNGIAVINTRPIVPYTVPFRPNEVSPNEKCTRNAKREIKRCNSVGRYKTCERSRYPRSSQHGHAWGSSRNRKTPNKNKTLKKVMKAHFSEEMARINIKAFDLGFEVSRNWAKRS